MTDQSTTERTHTCDCGFTWKHGLSGSHICGPYYRERIAELERKNAELVKALQQAKIVADIQSARIKRMEEQQNGFRSDFLLNGTRFKLNFSTRGNVDVFHNYAKELQGRWVALVPAEDDKHLARPASVASHQKEDKA